MEVCSGWLDAIRGVLQGIDGQATGELVELILAAEKIFVNGQGRSGMVAQCLATRLAQMGLNVNVPGLSTCQRIGPNDLFLGISCSGTTATTVQFARISKQTGAKVAVLTASVDSSLAKNADLVILIDANAESIRKQCKCVIGPQNNTLFEEAALLYCDLLVCVLLEKKGLPKDVIEQRHTNLQ